MSDRPSPAAGSPRGRSPQLALIVVLIYATFGALWTLLSDQLLYWFFSDPAIGSLAGKLNGLLFVAVSSLLLYALLQHCAAGQDRVSQAHVPSTAIVFPLLLTVTAVLSVTAVAIVGSLKQQRDREAARLEAAADMKTRLVAGWLKERNRDLRVAQTDPMLADAYRRWRVLGDDRAFGSLTRRIDDYGRELGYSEALLFDHQGTPLWTSAAAEPAEPEPTLSAAVSRAATDGRPARLGPYRDASDRVIIDFIAPITVTDAAPAVVVLRIAPKASLFPEIQHWPTFSRSAEALLFRVEGQDVLFLNDLRHRSDTAAKFRAPLSEKDLISAKVARGDARVGEVVDGVDYRKIPSVGIVKAVPGSDWFLVAKVDKAEIYHGAIRRIIAILLSALLACLAAGSAIILLRQRQRLAYSERIAAIQSEKLRALQLLDAIAESSTDAMFAKDPDGRYLLFNRNAVEFLGKEPGAVLGRDDRELFPPDQAAAMITADRQILADGKVSTFKERLDTPHGRLTVLTTKGPLRDADGHVFGLFGISRDITGLLRAEEQALLWAQAFQHAEFGLSIADCETNTFLSVNPAFARERGYAPEELNGQPVVSVYPPALHAEIANRERVLERTGHGVYESIHQRRDGTTFPVMLDITLIRAADGHPAQRIVYSLDITERKRAEEAIRRLNRDLRTLSECNQLLVRATEEQALLGDICRLLIDAGGYRMAWVGYAEQDETKSVSPMTAAGTGTEYLAETAISWADNERGQGPTGTAIRERRPVIARNLASDPHFETWRQAAERHGFASSIALPLLIDEATCIGALNIYSDETGRFSVDEQQHLLELSSDLAYGIRTLRDREAHLEAENALRVSEQRFRRLFDAAPIPLCYVGLEEVLLDVNARFLEIFGYGREEIPTLAEWWSLSCPDPEYRAWVKKTWQAALATAMERHTDIEPIEYRATCKNGKQLTVVISGSAVDSEFLAIFLDITERKEAETKLSAQLEELRRWHAVTLGREGRVLDLKREVNALLAEVGRPARYAAGE